MTEATTSPIPVPRSPPIPASGVSLRFTQELPMSRTRASAKGSSVSGPPTPPPPAPRPHHTAPPPPHPGRGRHDGKPQRLHLPQTRAPDLQRVGPEGDAVQPPAGARVHAAVTHEVAGVADRKHVAHEAFRGPNAGD